MNLNGYTLKSVKMMETPRGISYTGGIYYSGEKIGEAHNKGDGGMTHVYLNPDRRTHYKTLDEDFVERLFTLNDYERMFKRIQKSNPGKGIAFVTCENPFDLKCVICGQSEPLEEIVTRIRNSEPGWVVESIEVFRSLDDFNIDPSHQPDIFTASSTVFTEQQPKITESSVLGRISEAREEQRRTKTEDKKNPAPGAKKNDALEL